MSRPALHYVPLTSITLLQLRGMCPHHHCCPNNGRGNHGLRTKNIFFAMTKQLRLLSAGCPPVARRPVGSKRLQCVLLWLLWRVLTAVNKGRTQKQCRHCQCGPSQVPQTTKELSIATALRSTYLSIQTKSRASCITSIAMALSVQSPAGCPCWICRFREVA